MQHTARMLATLAGCAGLLSPAPLLAGAWGQEPNGMFLSLQSTFYSTDHYFDAQGSRRDRGGTFTKYELNPYLEYGLTARDTLTANLFYHWLEDDAAGRLEKNHGAADQEFGWKRQLLKQNGSVLAIHALVIVPAGYDEAGENPRLGYNRYGGEANLLYGHSSTVWGKNAMLDLRLGYRDYFGYPASQVRSNATIGYDIAERWQVLLGAELLYGLNNGTAHELAPSVLAETDYRLLKLSLALRYHLSDHYSLVAGGYAHAWGENTGSGGGGNVSLWHSF
ncbi:MAG: hypothetical protein BWK76_00040 [Desulfobulbaceae bacterium A2]|nr:MAG: hypothetical protein BWK76_00040 [Desulfobulbaceae bacterium A2]